MGLDELARQLNKVDVKYQGDDIKQVCQTNRTLRVFFRADPKDINKNTHCICDYVVYSFREAGFNLSLAKSDDFEIVQGAPNPRIGQRKTIYDVTEDNDGALFKINPDAPQFIAGYRPEELIQSIANYLLVLKNESFNKKR